MTPPSFLNKRTAVAAAPFPNRFRWLPDMSLARSGALPNSSVWGPDLFSPARDLIQKVPGVGDTGVPRNKRYAAILNIYNETPPLEIVPTVHLCLGLLSPSPVH